MLTYNKFFESKNYHTLYHFTPLTSVVGIIDHGELVSDKDINDLYHSSEDNSVMMFKRLEKKYGSFVSTTRNKNLNEVSSEMVNSLTCRIHLDGNKLSDNYKIIPVNYFNYEPEYMNQKNKYDESEEAILLRHNVEGIPFFKYCTQIDLPSFEEFKKELIHYYTNTQYMIDFLVYDVIPSTYKYLGIELDLKLEIQRFNDLKFQPYIDILNRDIDEYKEVYENLIKYITIKAKENGVIV